MEASSMSEPRVVRNETEGYTVLEHHDQGVGPLEGWMVEWVKHRTWAWIPDRIRDRYPRKAQVDRHVALAISEILGEDHESK